MAWTNPCPCCGDLLTYEHAQAVVTCPACGTRSKMPDERVRNRADFRNARQMQQRGDFINAEASYLRVLDEVPDDADALWGRLLCHYGAKMEIDRGGERRYTVSRARPRAFRAQGDFERACENSPPELAAQYEQDAAYIDGVLARIQNGASDQPDYDVFICHKTTMLQGEGLTRDYSRGRDLYDLLTAQGYKAFFAPEMLSSEAAGEDYEAPIYHALHTAKVMLVVCSDKQHLYSTWVRSEWERFLARRDEGDQVTLIPLLFGGMKGKDLPRAFGNLQAIEMEVKGTDVLLERLQTIIPKEKPRKKLPLWPILIVLVMALAVGGWFVAKDGGEEPGAGEAGTPAAAASDAPAPTTATPVPTTATPAPTTATPAPTTATPAPTTATPVPTTATPAPTTATPVPTTATPAPTTATPAPTTATPVPTTATPAPTTATPAQGCSHEETYEVEGERTVYSSGDWELEMFEVCLNCGYVVDNFYRIGVRTKTAEALVVDGYVIDVYSDNTCEIVGYTGDATELSIPENLDGYPVTSIGNNAFEGNFRWALTSVTIPNSVTAIGLRAFAKNDLSRVVIPGNVKTIGSLAFYGCRNLTEIIIEFGVEHIGFAAFQETAVDSITIPDSVMSIDGDIVAGCGDVQINVSSSHQRFEVLNGELYDKVEMRLIRASYSLKADSYTIQDGVRIIGNKAFYWRNLRRIHIPDSVTTIHENAFSQCTSLTNIVLPDSVTSIGDGAFYLCQSLKSITLPDGVTKIGEDMFGNCSSLTSIALPDGLTSIGDWAFWNCESLTSITLPEGLTSIGDRTFSGCSSLTSITLPEGLTSIGLYAFAECATLVSITLPDSVTSIGDDAFYDCPNLTLYVPCNSYAATYAEENGIPYIFIDDAVCGICGSRDECGCAEIYAAVKALNSDIYTMLNSGQCTGLCKSHCVSAESAQEWIIRFEPYARYTDAARFIKSEGFLCRICRNGTECECQDEYDEVLAQNQYIYFLLNMDECVGLCPEHCD